MDDNPKTADLRQQGHGPRLLCLSPDRFVLSLLLGVCLLWLSDRFQWVGFNRHKGWAVLIAVGIVGVAAIVMLVWWDLNLTVLVVPARHPVTAGVAGCCSSSSVGSPSKGSGHGGKRR